MRKHSVCLLLLVVALSLAHAQAPSAQPSSAPALPYSPSLDLSSMDKSVDPCVDLYHYSCGGWQKKNPIPPDQTSWSVYGKLYQDNLTFLRGMLEQAAQPDAERNAVTRQIGDFYAACMDETTVEKRGLTALQPELDAVAQIKSAKELAPLVARLQLIYARYSYTSPMFFSAGSAQDPDDSEQVIADVDQGGLGMPDRDYYLKDDAKSKETREHYLQHVRKVFELIGDSPEAAQRNAETVMRLETAMAKASLTRVERRDPHKLVHKMKVADLIQLASNFDWSTYYNEMQYPQFAILNVDAP
jgi:endothelin-converting enzyme/putative endopeptidase